MAHIGLVTLVVRDYDEAIDFYLRAVGFNVVEDTVLDEHKRWVVLAPPGASGSATRRGTRRPVPDDQRSRPRLSPDAEGRGPVPRAAPP